MNRGMIWNLLIKHNHCIRGVLFTKLAGSASGKTCPLFISTIFPRRSQAKNVSKPLQKKSSLNLVFTSIFKTPETKPTLISF